MGYCAILSPIFFITNQFDVYLTCWVNIFIWCSIFNKYNILSVVTAKTKFAEIYYIMCHYFISSLARIVNWTPCCIVASSRYSSDTQKGKIMYHVDLFAGLPVVWFRDLRFVILIREFLKFEFSRRGIRNHSSWSISILY